MLKFNYIIALMVLLTLSMASFSQDDVSSKTSLPSTLFSLDQIGDAEGSAFNSYDTEFSEVFSLEMAYGSASSRPGLASANNAEKSAPKNIISLKFGADDPWVGMTYERLFGRYIGAEVQIGLIGASVGPKIYFPAIKNGRLNFYVGALHGWGFMGGQKTYFPIGVNVLTKRSFRFSLDAGPRIWHGEGEENFLGASIKIGKGF